MNDFSSPKIKEEKLQDPEGTMREYKETGDVELRNKLVMHYLQYVNIAIYSMRSVLLSNIPFEDFFNEGIIALMNCIDRYDPYRGVATFDTYSYAGIRGAILKYHRKQNWLPNRLWEARNKIAKARIILEQELMREPTQKELADHLQMSEETLSKYTIEMAVVNTVSFEELIEETFGNVMACSANMASESADNNILIEEMHVALAKAIDKLTPKQKQIVSLHYFENLNLREIGEVLDLSQQRVSQLRKKALEKMQEELSDFNANLN